MKCGHNGPAFQHGTGRPKLRRGCFCRQGKCSPVWQRPPNLLLILAPWLLWAFEFEILCCTGESLKAFGIQRSSHRPYWVLALIFHLSRTREKLFKYALESPPSFHASSLSCLGKSLFLPCRICCFVTSSTKIFLICWASQVAAWSGNFTSHPLLP